MSIANGNTPAMPIELNGFGLYEPAAYMGMTKREMFAMAAMQACRSRHSNYPSWEALSKDAVEIADALLAELERTQ